MFDHYRDMNQDGVKDIYDVVVTASMEEEDEREYRRNNGGVGPHEFSKETMDAMYYFAKFLAFGFVILLMIMLS